VLQLTSAEFDGPISEIRTILYNFVMNPIEAVYQNGVFKPLGKVGLPENERVRLSAELVARQNLSAWLDDVKELQGRIIAERGYFPDSTPDIAEDRLREV
jgi:predicted DNA-binding antitoxin AbrB/MazE fold protein